MSADDDGDAGDIRDWLLRAAEGEKPGASVCGLFERVVSAPESVGAGGVWLGAYFLGVASLASSLATVDSKSVGVCCFCVLVSECVSHGSVCFVLLKGDECLSVQWRSGGKVGVSIVFIYVLGVEKMRTLMMLNER